MASQYFAILTDYGTRAIAHALSQGQPLQLAKFAVGDGNGQAVTPTASATALVHQTHSAPVSAVSLDPRNNKQVIVELTIPENVGGFYIREMGVFDAQNKLIAYANCPESFKPTESSGSGKVQVLRMILKVESSSAVTLSIDNSVIFVTRQQMTPKTITATTQNGFDDSGHSHEINKASTSQQGIVQLTNDTGLESESLALTAKAGKKLAQLIATVQLALNNYIPLNKRSSAVNSNDENNVATSKAVKTAYDKGVEAKNAADNAQRSANDGINRANNAQSSANEANNNANGRVSKSGDTMTGQLNANSGVNTLARGADGFNHQWQNLTAPYLVDNGNSNGNNAYYPFIKGINRNGNTWGTAFSFGYETPDGINKFGRGCIHLIEDNGTQKLWRFEHNGDFNSAGDVSTSSGKYLNNSVQISELVGEVAFFARTTPPSGWLKANGAAVSRTTYAALFAAIGTTFGAGDGSSTFNLPDLRGEFVRGLDDGRNVDGGRRLGTNQGDAIRNITGAFDTSKGSWAQQFVDFAETSGAFDLIKGNKQWTGDPNNGGNNLPTGFKFDASRVVPTANENRPRNIALLACIKY
nr:MAG TPA: tail collar fiber protein [Caudoviricetes sp.]